MNNTTAIVNTSWDVPFGMSVATAVYLATIHVLGVPGNIVTAIVYARTSPKTACDWLILTMSITDAFVCFCSPLMFMRSFQRIRFPWTTYFLCAFEYWLQLSAMLASCTFLVIIAMDRYVKICKPAKKSLTPVMARNVCLLCIIFSAVFCGIPFLFRMEMPHCFEPGEPKYTDGSRIFFSCLFVVYLISLCILTHAYVCVCKQIREKIKLKQRLLENSGLKSPNKLQIKEKKIKYRILGFCQRTFSNWRQKPRATAEASNYDINSKDSCSPDINFSLHNKDTLNKNVQHNDNSSDSDKSNSLSQPISQTVLSNNHINKHAVKMLENTTQQILKSRNYLEIINKPRISYPRPGGSLQDIKETLYMQHSNHSDICLQYKEHLQRETSRQREVCPKCAELFTHSCSNERNTYNVDVSSISVKSDVTLKQDKNSKIISVFPSSPQQKITGPAASGVTTAYSLDSVFLDSNGCKHPNHDRETELWNSSQISPKRHKTLSCNGLYSRHKNLEDIEHCLDASDYHVAVLFDSRVIVKRRTSSLSSILGISNSKHPWDSSTFLPQTRLIGYGSSRPHRKITSCPNVFLTDSIECSKLPSCAKDKELCSNRSSASDKITNVGLEDATSHKIVYTIQNSIHELTGSQRNLAQNKKSDVYLTSLDGHAPSRSPSVTFSNVVKEIPLNHLPSHNSHISILSPEYSDVPDAGSENSQRKSVSMNNIQREAGHTNVDIKDTRTLALPCSATRGTHKSADSISYRDSKKASGFLGGYETESLVENSSYVDDRDEVFSDMPTVLLFSQRNKEKCRLKSTRESLKSTSSRKMFARERRMTLMLLTVTATFLTFWIPPWIFYLVCMYGPLEYSKSALFQFFVTVHLLNYVTSPLIYYVFNPNFRSKFNQLLSSACRRLCCSRMSRTSEKQI